MARFEATTAAGPDRVTVTLSGDCDLAVRDRLTAVLLEAVHSGKPVCVEMSGVGFLDSTGIHALVTAHRAAQERGSRLSLTGARGAVAAVLELTGLDRLLRDPAEERRHV